MHRKFFANIDNPKIFSAMAMAMSIYRTLCVLVLMKPLDVFAKYFNTSVEGVRSPTEA